jgi:hypothetical protein
MRVGSSSALDARTESSTASSKHYVSVVRSTRGVWALPRQTGTSTVRSLRTGLSFNTTSLNKWIIPHHLRMTACGGGRVVHTVVRPTAKAKQQLTVFLVQPSNRRGNRAETLMPQCAFKMSMLNVSAIRIKSRSWLRSSSTHEPSDPPLGIVLFQSRQM